jgi:hypothetical protein
VVFVKFIAVDQAFSNRTVDRQVMPAFATLNPCFCDYRPHEIEYPMPLGDSLAVDEQASAQALVANLIGKVFNREALRAD